MSLVPKRIAGSSTPFRLDETAGQGLYETDQGFGFDLSKDVDVPGVGDFGAAENQRKLEAVFGEIDGVYQKLVQAGKTQQAFALRDAADKFRRTGKSLGVNSFRRVRALKDLESALNVSAQQREAGLAAARLGELRNTIGQMSQMSNAAFSKGMQRADFRERKLESLRGVPEQQAPVLRRTASARGPRLRRGAQRSGAARTDARGRMFATADRQRRTIDLANSFRRTGGGVLDRTSLGPGQGDIASPFQQASGLLARGETGFTRGGPPQPLASPVVARNPNFVPGGNQNATFRAPGTTLVPGSTAVGRRAAARSNRGVTPVSSTARRFEFEPLPAAAGGGFNFISPTTAGGFRQGRLIAGRRVS